MFGKPELVGRFTDESEAVRYTGRLAEKLGLEYRCAFGVASWTDGPRLLVAWKGYDFVHYNVLLYVKD